MLFRSWSQRAGQSVAPQLQEVGDEKEATGTGGGYPAFEQGRHLLLDTVAGDNDFPWFAGAIENLDFLFGQEAGRECLGFQRFFLLRP